MGTELQIDLHEQISTWSVRAIIEQLRASPAADVLIRINSPGGSVTDGWTLANVLRGHAGKKTALVEGVCASAATFVLCACDVIRMYPESMLMLHAPGLDYAGGNADDLEADAEVLRKMESLCVGMYMRRTGADEQTVREWMSRGETWWTPDESQSIGLCDEVLTTHAPPSARARAARYVALLGAKKIPKPIPKAKAKDKKMADTEETAGGLPAEIADKLAEYGLPEDPTPDDIKKAEMRYLEETEDGPSDRRAVVRAVAEATGAEASAKAEDDGDEDTEDKSAKAKLSGLDPAVAKLVDSLTGRVAKLDKDLGTYRRAEAQRKEADFYASAAAHTTKEDAADYLAKCGGDTAKALSLIAKLPRTGTSGRRLFSGGDPVGGTAKSASQHAEKTRQVGRVTLHGFAFSAKAKELAKAEKISLGEAQLRLVREQPDLMQ